MHHGHSKYGHRGRQQTVKGMSEWCAGLPPPQSGWPSRDQCESTQHLQQVHYPSRGHQGHHAEPH